MPAVRHALVHRRLLCFEICWRDIENERYYAVAAACRGQRDIVLALAAELLAGDGVFVTVANGGIHRVAQRADEVQVGVCRVAAVSVLHRHLHAVVARGCVSVRHRGFRRCRAVAEVPLDCRELYISVWRESYRLLVAARLIVIDVSARFIVDQYLPFKGYGR